MTTHLKQKTSAPLFLFYIQINKYFFEDNTVIQAKVSILEPET